jgi:hypothetical protein
LCRCVYGSSVPISLKNEDGLLIADFEGRITADELLRGAREVRKIEEQEPITPDRLIDLTRMDAVDLDFTVVNDFAQLRAQSPLKNPTKSAIVAPSALQYGFGRMYQTLNQNPQLEVRMFQDSTQAREWLRPKDPTTNA